MDGFFSEQPCYRIEILEWINEEDITDEWRYIWKHDPPEPVYEVMMGGFVESLNLAFVYESIYTRSEYEQIRQSGFDYQRCCGEPIFSRTAQTMMLTMKRTRTRELELRPSGYLNLRFFHGCGGSSRGAHADGTITQLLPEIGTK